MQSLQQAGMDVNDVFAKPKPKSDRCVCHHAAAAHTDTAMGPDTGRCLWKGYGTSLQCHCRRYRNYDDIKAEMREEEFWAGVGKHQW